MGTAAWLSRIIWFSGKIPILGHWLRRCAQQFQEGSIVTIKSGYASGLKWKRYKRYVNGYWLGQYELPLQHALWRELGPHQCVFDVGANAGFFTLVAAKRVGSFGKVVAFEPHPQNAETVREQIALNGMRQCEVAEAGIAANEGVSFFSYPETEFSTTHLGDPRAGELTLEVPVTTLDLACTKYGTPNLIKMDIEGGEVEALKGASQLLVNSKVTWLIELHGQSCSMMMQETLSEYGYELFTLDGERVPPAFHFPNHLIARK
jgi:FkbM family methyltransferase